MAPNVVALDRLKAQLLTSGLQERNNALFQVINQLIDNLRQGIDTLSQQITVISGGGGGSGGGSTIITSGAVMPRDGEDGDMGLPGIQGPPGLQGPIGPMGPPGMDADCCDDWSMPFIGNSIIDPAAGSIGAYVQRIP